MPDADVGAVTPRIQEETDTKLFLHVAATTVAGHRRVIVRTSDSAVFLGVSTFVALGQQIGELWIAFGMRQHYRYITVQDNVRELGPSKTLALRAIHALSGCDTHSLARAKRQHGQCCSLLLTRTYLAPTAAL